MAIRKLAMIMLLDLAAAPASAFVVADPTIRSPSKIQPAMKRSLPASRRITSSSLQSNHQHSMAGQTTRFTTPSSGDEGESSISYTSLLARPVLAALDFAALVVFALVGSANHAENGVDVLGVLAVALPFVVSWFAVTPLLGLYEGDATRDTTRALLVAGKGWIVAVPLGCVLRGLIKGYVPPLPFVVVTLIATLVVLGGTRVAYTVVSQQGDTKE